ncbi:ABC transporter ATP-binding protein [Streptomyces sp. TRM70308]|uniref:ABC transporter ATP-binding protein n=1 Tax=Streptomyces sp. TRM70308 TaxID=3131932 RepID=UPI003CFF85FD
MIEALGLTKRYGAKTAVYDLSFQVRPGVVTGFLGPNGSGKSTTMRMMLGLDEPTSGTVTIDGVPFRRHRAPAREVGALLDAKAIHGGRSARSHLLCLAQLSGLPKSRVDEVLDLVGLRSVARKRSKGFSLGMGQRLGIAAALLGDPKILMFDEPVNGLDPEGIRWVRELMRRLAAEGRTVFVSSHLMSEMALTADHLIVIGRGQLLADQSVKEFVAANSADFALVRTPDDAPDQREKLSAALSGAGARVLGRPDGALRVDGLPLPRISDLAHESGVRLWELSPHQASLEEAYMRMTQGAVDYAASVGGPGPQGAYGAPHGQPPHAGPPAGPYAAPHPGGGYGVPPQGAPPAGYGSAPGQGAFGAPPQAVPTPPVGAPAAPPSAPAPAPASAPAPAAPPAPAPAPAAPPAPAPPAAPPASAPAQQPTSDREDTR